MLLVLLSGIREVIAIDKRTTILLRRIVNTSAYGVRAINKPITIHGCCCLARTLTGSSVRVIRMNANTDDFVFMIFSFLIVIQIRRGIISRVNPCLRKFLRPLQSVLQLVVLSIRKTHAKTNNHLHFRLGLGSIILMCQGIRAD